MILLPVAIYKTLANEAQRLLAGATTVSAGCSLIQYACMDTHPTNPLQAWIPP